MTAVRVRAPATTANVGPGFDCAAIALDLWNELEVRDGDGPTDADHLGVRAFSLLASPAGRAFAFTDRIPRERGLGSSAAVIALGLVAAAATEGLELGAEELLAAGLELEGHADNLAAALAGGACLTWSGRIARIADDPPAMPSRSSPDATVSTVAARASLPEQVPHADATFTAARAALLGAALATGDAELFASGARRSAARTAPCRERSAPRAVRAAPAGRRARRDALRLGPDRDRVGSFGRGRRLRRRARVPATPTSTSSTFRLSAKGAHTL